MSTINDVFQSTRERKLGLRKRTDLTIVEHVYRNERFYLIKDPLELQFYRLNEEEHAVLQLVDGTRSLDSIKEQFERLFPPQRISHRQLQSFITDLHTKSLLAYDADDVGSRLLDREAEKRRAKLKKNALSVLTWRWRGVDPDRFLDWLTPKVGWLFSLPMVILSLLFMASAALWLLVHFDTFTSRLPALAQFLDQRNWLLLGVVIIVMKIMHELGHGVSFKRFGGECHEIGVMLLVLMPTLYCSTTDSWLLPSKWKRSAIGAAGMYVELLIAAAATFGWWFSEPGTFNMICLNIMATGSISVVLFNANPFLKYDGYYIFADVMELPNLRERSGKMTQSWFLRAGLGVDEDAEPNSLWSTKLTLVAYKLCAFTFRVFIIVAILFLLIDRLKPLGLGHLGLALGTFAVCAMVVPPLWSLYKFFQIPGRWQRVEMKKALVTLIVVGLLAALVFAVPMPQDVTCSFTIQPHDGQTLYVKHDAILKAVHVSPGEHVEADHVIATLENLETLLTLTELKSEGDEQRAELTLLERTRESSAATATRIEELREAIATNRQSVAEYEEVLSSFKIVAPRSGQVIPEWTNMQPAASEELASWDGSPLSAENVGTWLGSGQKLCMIGDLSQFDAVLVINEHDISNIQTGQPVTLMLDSMAGRRVRGTIEVVARKQSEELPSSLTQSSGGNIQLRQDAHSQQSTQANDEHFEARVPMPEMAIGLSSGLRGHARIRVGSQTLYQRLARAFYRNLRKKL